MIGCMAVTYSAVCLSRGDIAVLFGVVDNYYQRHGNSRAAHSYLAAGAGLSRRAVITSVKRLRALGYLEVARIGSGTRPTEYVPNWWMLGNLTTASGEPDNIAEVNCISPQESPAVNATSPKPAYVAGLQAGLRKQGPAPPPPPGGPDEPPAAPARNPFDELWDAYGRKHERSKAKAEYQKLDPDQTLHKKIVRAAADWTAAYEAQARPKKYWKYLHTWLASECWLEDLPEPYETSKMAATTKRRKRDAEVDEYCRTWLQHSLRPGNRALARFIDYVEIDVRNGIAQYDCDLMVLDGCPITGRVTRRLWATDKEFDEFCAACGDNGRMSMDELCGARLWITMGTDGRVGYVAYDQTGLTTHRNPPLPPAIGSSSGKTDAGGEGAIEF
jgi:hypothetical protein